MSPGDNATLMKYKARLSDVCSLVSELSTFPDKNDKWLSFEKDNDRSGFELGVKLREKFLTKEPMHYARLQSCLYMPPIKTFLEEILGFIRGGFLIVTEGKPPFYAHLEHRDRSIRLPIGRHHSPEGKKARMRYHLSWLRAINPKEKIHSRLRRYLNDPTDSFGFRKLLHRTFESCRQNESALKELICRVVKEIEESENIDMSLENIIKDAIFPDPLEQEIKTNVGENIVGFKRYIFQAILDNLLDSELVEVAKEASKPDEGSYEFESVKKSEEEEEGGYILMEEGEISLGILLDEIKQNKKGENKLFESPKGLNLLEDNGKGGYRKGIFYTRMEQWIKKVVKSDDRYLSYKEHWPFLWNTEVREVFEDNKDLNEQLAALQNVCNECKGLRVSSVELQRIFRKIVEDSEQFYHLFFPISYEKADSSVKSYFIGLFDQAGDSVDFRNEKIKMAKQLFTLLGRISVAEELEEAVREQTKKAERAALIPGWSHMNKTRIFGLQTVLERIVKAEKDRHDALVELYNRHLDCEQKVLQIRKQSQHYAIRILKDADILTILNAKLGYLNSGISKISQYEDNPNLIMGELRRPIDSVNSISILTILADSIRVNTLNVLLGHHGWSEARQVLLKQVDRDELFEKMLKLGATHQDEGHNILLENIRSIVESMHISLVIDVDPRITFPQGENDYYWQFLSIAFDEIIANSFKCIKDVDAGKRQMEIRIRKVNGLGRELMEAVLVFRNTFVGCIDANLAETSPGMRLLEQIRNVIHVAPEKPEKQRLYETKNNNFIINWYIPIRG